MGKVCREARLLFVLTWTLADDSGRLRGDSRMLASLLFPYDDDVPKKIEGWLSELVAQNCIIRYRADGSSYIQICKWLSHQKIDKPSPSKIPPFDEDSRGLSDSSRTVVGGLDLDQGPRIRISGAAAPLGGAAQLASRPPAERRSSSKPEQVEAGEKKPGLFAAIAARSKAQGVEE
jgi:hypothetical protein